MADGDVLLDSLIYGYGYRDNGVGELVDSMLVNNRLV